MVLAMAQIEKVTQNRQINVAILGSGAIGSLLAYKCEKLDQKYCILSRNGKPLTLNVRSFEQSELQFSPLVQSLNNSTQFDLLILPLKAYQIMPALDQLLPYILPNQHLVLLHNGMGTIEQVKTLLPNNPVLAATTSYGAYKEGKHSVIETGLGHTHAGWLNKHRNDHSKQVEQLISALLPPCTWHLDVQKALWHKLAINAVINPLTAINQVTNGQLRQTEYRQLIEQLCQENSAVMNACGYVNTANELLENAYKVIRDTAENYSSMNRDIAFCRESEIDFINGFIVQQGCVHNIATPLNTELVADIKNLQA
jgi:2-dehydropantoate 2-reductase